MQLYDYSEIKGTAFVEFNISGTVDKYKFNQKDSLYMRDNDYEMISKIFEKYSDNFNYFGPTLYEIPAIRNLRKELVEKSDKESSKDRKEVFEELSALMRKCSDQNQVLWVLGI